MTTPTTSTGPRDRGNRPVHPDVLRAATLSGQVAVVTGASRGIGRAVAVRLGTLGASVVVNYSRSAAEAHETVQHVEQAGGTAVAVQADVSRPEQVASLFDAAQQHFGLIDVVVVNAGIDELGSPLLEVTEAEYDRMQAVNAKGAFFTLQQAARTVRDGGSIVTVGSSTAVRPVAGFGLYGASKVPATYLTGVLAQELAARGVTVNSVIPTATDGAGYFAAATEDDPVRVAARAASTIGSRMGTVEDVADVVEFFVGPLARWISGQQLLVSGGAPS